MNPATQPFNIEVLESPAGARLFKLTGPLTLRTLFEFQDTSRQETVKPVIVDLTGVPYMDSAGLGSIVSLFTACQGSGRGFAIVGLTDRIRALFQITRVDGLIPCFDSIGAAEGAVIPL